MSMPPLLHICIIYQTDLATNIAGGIDTFIKGLIKYAPDDFIFSLIGCTTKNTHDTPTGKWQHLLIDGKTYRYMPIFSVDTFSNRSIVPLSIKMALLSPRHAIGKAFDIIDFHRIESSLFFYFSKTKKVLYVHQNMCSITNRSSDMKWKYFPKLYFWLENIFIPQFRTIFCVREDAANAYKIKFPSISHNFTFTPTWVDDSVFYPFKSAQRNTVRLDICQELGLEPNKKILVTVGRLDQQKNPLMLLDAFSFAINNNSSAQLIFVGDGVLKNALLDKIENLGLKGAVVITGLRSSVEVARILNASDLFVLSSAYEGMPICVLEALATGIPVVSTPVGEVPRVIHSGKNGELTVHTDSPEDLGRSIERCLSRLPQYTCPNCVDSIQPFTPRKVLTPIYDNYRRIAAETLSK